MRLTAKSRNCVIALFRAADASGAEVSLMKLPDYPDAERLQLAAIRFSSGTLERLNMAIDIANSDPRDLLMASGIGDLESHKNWIPQRTDDSIVDRWLNGSLIDGVAFGPSQRVQKTGGRRAKEGTVMLLVHLEPQPCYRVNLDSVGEREVWQSELRPG